VKNAGLLMAICCGLAIAGAQWPGTVTALPDERPVSLGAVAPTLQATPVGQGRVNVPPKALVGTLDTIGGTTYDWLANGPMYRMIVNSPIWGVNVLWMYSTATTGQDFPDRNMRYNYYDFATHAWNWIDADYMQSGVNVFDKRAGYGSIDVDPEIGIAIVGGHVDSGSDKVPRVARDAAPGAGIFEYADGAVLGITQWPPISVSQNGTISIFPMTAAYEMSYSNIVPGNWPTFSTPVTGIVPSPGFSSHNIAASKVSNKVSLVWEISTNTPEDAYQMNSTDGGITWDTPATLDPPAAFGGDTMTSYYITSLFPWYDRQDKFHVVANLMPMVNDTGYIFPAQIWHYCPDNDPQWSRIHTASVDPANYLYSITSNASLACRPSIGQDNDGDLFVTWEQFDTLNYEPTTSRARADIWLSRSDDNGLTWGTGLKVTDAGSYSMRFPCIIDLAVEGGSDPDTIYIVYEIDSVSGFYVAAGTLPSEGPASGNPIVVQKVPVQWPAVAEQKGVKPAMMDAVASPNPFHARTQISYVLPSAGRVVLEVFDLTGRSVARPVDCLKSAGRYSTTLSAKGLAPGVYVARLSAGGRCLTRKLVLTE
jgi:hypothetical protein